MVAYEYYSRKHAAVTSIELVLEPRGAAGSPAAIQLAGATGSSAEIQLAARGDDLFGDHYDIGPYGRSAMLTVNPPPGHYRAFLRLKNGNEVVSESHSLDITISPPKPVLLSLTATPQPSVTSTAPIRKWFEQLREWGVAIILAAVALLILSYFFRSRRRVRQFTAGNCIHCGYDLRATPGRCPECGLATMPRGSK